MIWIIAFFLVILLGVLSGPSRGRGGYRAVDDGRGPSDTNIPKPPKGPGGGSK